MRAIPSSAKEMRVGIGKYYFADAPETPLKLLIVPAAKRNCNADRIRSIRPFSEASVLVFPRQKLFVIT
jgi:hypothetical protein